MSGNAQKYRQKQKKAEKRSAINNYFIHLQLKLIKQPVISNNNKSDDEQKIHLDVGRHSSLRHHDGFCTKGRVYPEWKTGQAHHV